ncbi:ABC-type phosphate transport system substrate-binding protein [Variovorax boronicumulans]|uniref:substrate-binding domain-containing protein n=1 Tax=Variovorax boronicumulans TaxID=436515 RepID=UPI002789E7D9|nr:substrate-binding domain-containing protein [Variovorax boronicumulans]MDQ0072497.1 ABC-type phosphate transport system substrate-binding protein [Variovorax boronicumulans]
MNAKFKSAALSAVTMACLLAAGAASAQIVRGGGATLPESLYDAILPSGIGQTNFSYTGTGSGAGKSGFFNNNATAFKNESVAGTPNWTATESVHFAGSDSAVSVAERDAYNTAHVTGVTGAAAWSRMIQIPAVATSVMVPYKRAGVTALDLTDAKVCAIFGNRTGAGRTWGQVLGTTDATQVAVVYRGESSGTTELLANYLVAACNPLGYNFAVSSTFTTVVAGEVGTVPAHWVSVTGNPGMAASFGVDGRIGYMSPDPAFNPSNNTQVSKVNGNLPVEASIRAALAPISLPVGGASQASDPRAWVPAYAKPATGYPIFGTTNLLVNQCYKDASVQAKVKAFLTGLLGTTYDAQIAAHNFVTLPNGAPSGNNWKTQISNVFLNANHPLGIGNVNVCNGIGRPLTN